MMRSQRIIVALVAAHALIGAIEAALSARPMGDFLRYWTIATAHGRPYVDYRIEFPPGTLLVFKAIAALGGGRAMFSALIVLLDIAADFAIVRVLWLEWGREAAIFYLAAVLPMLPILNYRIDLWSTACAAVAFAAWRRERTTVGSIALSIGAALKLWPLPLAAWLFGDSRPRLRSTIVLASAFGAILIVWIALAGLDGPRQVVTFRAATGWEIESTVGAIWALVDPRSLRIESGAWRIGATTPALSMVLFAASAPIIVAAAWIGGRTLRIGVAWIAAIGVLLITSPLFSAQYVAWLAPAAAIAWVERDRVPAVLVAIAIVLTSVCFVAFRAALDGSRVAIASIVIRNAVVVAATAAAARALLRAARGDVSVAQLI